MKSLYKKALTLLFLLIVSIFILTSFNSQWVNAATINQPSIICIDTPRNGAIIENKDTINIAGWSLNSSGVKEVKVYIDGVYKESATIALNRPDVAAAYPGYIDGEKSGYKYILDINNIPSGFHQLTIEAIGNDGSTKKESLTIEIKKPAPITFIDMPFFNSTYKNKNIEISGWAVNYSKVKEVKIYVDSKYAGNAQTGFLRPDVKAVFPTYPESDKSGYKYTLGFDKLSGGKHTITVEGIGNDGSVSRESRVINVEKLEPITFIDNPRINSIHSSTNLFISGWAINPKGIKQVKIYLDNNLVGDAETGILRYDVAKVFPGYIDGEKSGYKYNLDTSKVMNGNHLVTVEAIGNDGIIKKESINIIIKKPEPITFIDSPISNSTSKERYINVSGWALNASGIKVINIYVDGILTGTSLPELSRPDVALVFPQYPAAAKSGYKFNLDTKELLSGKHILKVEGIGNDGSKKSEETAFILNKLDPITYIDNPKPNSYHGNNKVYISGWAVNMSGVKEIKIYINDKYINSANKGISRPDVAAAFPKYPDAAKSGYNFELDMTEYPIGKYNLKVESIGNDDTKRIESITFYTGRTIVIDAGHNYGGNDGAYAKHNDITYVERDLNMQVAIKLRDKLKEYGFNVVMTREEWDRSIEDSAASLARRVEIANSANAELFISIHHDSSKDPNTSGISTHYSSWRPNIDNEGIYVGRDLGGWYEDVNLDSTPSQPAVESKKLAQLFLDGILSLGGYNNQKIHDHNLAVTSKTNMPSVLIESGFISNAKEAARSADPNNQQLIANKIAEIVYNYYYAK